MEPGCTNLTEIAHAVQLLKINGFSTTTTMSNSEYIESIWNVDGYDWELRLFPWFMTGCPWVALKFIFLGEPRTSAGARTKIRCRIVDPSGNLEPSQEKGVTKEFYRSGASSFFLLMKVNDVLASDYLTDDDSLTVECSITVLKELKRITIPSAKKDEAVCLAMPPSDLHEHLGELLRSQKGSDVTFTVSGESFGAHKLVLAARSPVFMAEFFGGMEEGSSKSVVIEDMEAVVFKAMLHFIYTDTAPELDDAEPDAAKTAAAVMAQHLLAAAERYELLRLKVMCEVKLSGGIDVDTAATTLALAEQHNCSLLRAKCVEFITASPETLDAVLATEGYKHLVASCPLVFTELLKSAHARKN
jgi:speckle-type POZ protein